MTVIALDHDDVAIRELRRISRDTPAPRLDVIQGDVRKLELPDMQLDGALSANVLHFVEDPAPVLARVRTHLRSQARVLVVEYEQRAQPLGAVSAAAAPAGGNCERGPGSGYRSR